MGFKKQRGTAWRAIQSANYIRASLKYLLKFVWNSVSMKELANIIRQISLTRPPGNCGLTLLM